MRSFLVNWTRIILVVILVGMFGAVYAQNSVGNVLQLWNVRNNLSGSFQQSADINLWVTNPANISPWSADSTYAVGEIRKHTDGFAYYCEYAQVTSGTFSTDKWTKMWEAAKGWDPIGDATTPFQGIYDGGNKTVKNLYINRKATTASGAYFSDGEDNNGLFGLVQPGQSTDAEIKNLGIINPNVSGRRATGSLVGKSLVPSGSRKKVFITRCYAKPDEVGGTATVSGLGATGGLVGANNSDRKQQVPVIQYCWTNVIVSSTHPTHVGINPDDRPNPYNIKYGGIVGCNETGVTFDSYAWGSVSGGDRVGGIAGCTIDGAIIRCYAIGNVTLGISSSSWQGGVGGITGRIVGKLPPGLGGYQGSGSVQYSYYNSGITINSAGGPVNYTGATSSEAMTTNQNTYVNWDFTSVWSFTTNSYPYSAGSAPTLYYYKSTSSGNWSTPGTWKTSPTDGGSYETLTSIYPDFTNSAGIIIGVATSVDVDVFVDNMKVDSGQSLTISSGKKLYVQNGEIETELTNNGTITVTDTLEVGQSAGFQNNGILNINGTFINSGTTDWASGTTNIGVDSTIKYNGALAQSTGNGFPSSIQNMEIDNAAGVTFTNPFTINGTLTVTDGLVGGTTNTDGFHSMNFQRLEIAESGNLISGFSAATDLGGNYPELIKRQWTINGFVDDSTEENRVKSMTFYWTADDDNSFDWSGITPALYVGSSTTGITGTFTNSDGIRKLVVSYTFPQTAVKNGAKASFTIGREDNQTLPVELSFFNAQMYQGNSIRLQWQTQSETNVSGFQIYRGTSDLFAEALLLDVFINATNTSQAQYYVFYDRELYAPGTYYYWLESVDFDGSSQLYGSIPVYFEGIEPGVPSIPAITGIVKNYPNPFNPHTNIVFGLEKDGALILDVYNARGQKVRSLFSGNRKSGWYQMEWDGKNDAGQQLGSGVYFMRMQADSKTMTHKVVMMK